MSYIRKTGLIFRESPKIFNGLTIVVLFSFSRNKEKYASTTGEVFWEKQSGVIWDALIATVCRGKTVGAKRQDRMAAILGKKPVRLF